MRKALTLLLAAAFCGRLLAAGQSIAPPPVPDSLDFAGERVPLQNRDTRESLQRELTITIFMHSRTLATLLNAERHFTIIKPIMFENGVPMDFIYLCMAESALNPEAVSGAGAAGLWQLMPAVGRQYGLIVNKDIDERFHVEKATEAACKYLRHAYDRFGSWTMSAASYNLGMTGVATRIAKQHADSYYDMYFPEETLRYMFRVLSFKLLTEDPEKYGFDVPFEVRYKPFEGYNYVEVSDKEIDWPKVAMAHGTSYKMLRELNPWIRSYDYKNAKGDVFMVKIPAQDHRN